MLCGVFIASLFISVAFAHQNANPLENQHQGIPAHHQQQQQHHQQQQQQVPQHQNQQVPQHQNQQVPQHQNQQVPQHQNQQVPQQQQNQQQQQQNQQQNAQHINAQPPPPPSHFGSDNDIKDQEHIKSHLDGQVNTNEQMTNEQLQFHYFTMHDLNKDNRLDGIELCKAITHFHGDDPKNAPPKLSENEIEDMIDSILKDDDYNQDGFIDFSEFLKSQAGRQ